jgi:hypothetical protein
MPEYTPASYGMGFTVSRANDAYIVARPGWFARVFLRRKPKTIHLFDVARGLAAAAKENEAAMVRDLFESGRT